MRKLALWLVALTLGCVDPGPTGPLLPEASFVCDVAATIADDVCAQATGSITLEIFVVSVTPGP